MQETWVQSLGREDPLEKEMATDSTRIFFFFAWKIPRTGDVIGYSPWDGKESDMTE